MRSSERLGRSEIASLTFDADLELGSHDLGRSISELRLVNFCVLDWSVCTASARIATADLSASEERPEPLLSRSSLVSKSGSESNEGMSKGGRLGKVLRLRPRWCWEDDRLGAGFANVERETRSGVE